MFKHRLTQLSDEEYSHEFQRLVNEVENQFSIGDTPYEQLVSSMGALEKEMNHNGGCNWEEEDYSEYLGAIRHHLTSEQSFMPEQVAKIGSSLDEIIACGRELEQHGESRRNVTEAVDYLVARVVDWCRLHPKKGTNA